MSYQAANQYVTNIVPLFNVANSAGGATLTDTTNITNLESLLDYDNKQLNIDTITSFNGENIQINNNININGQLYINNELYGPDSTGVILNNCTSFAISTSTTSLNVNKILNNVEIPYFNINMNADNVFSIDSGGNASFLNPVVAPAFNIPSDIRYKTDIFPLSNSLSTVCELKGVRYIIDNISTLGLIAQEADNIIPSLVNKNDSDKWTVNYLQIIPVLIESIKELKEELTILKTKLGLV